MPDPLDLSKKERKILIEQMRDFKIAEREPEPVLMTPILPPKPAVVLTPTEYVCPDCNLKFPFLTKEHIVPQWLFNPSTLLHLGLRGKYIGNWSIVAQKNTRYICQPCNSKKGGELRADHHFSRQFLKYLIKEMQGKLDAVNIQVKVKVICKCNEIS